jgi:FkbM family methyltransferase
MTMISYAQNFEDVMLLRALGQIQDGLYIDVGAQHPVHGSVTKAFYQRGWRGINIEPVTQWFEELVRDRVEDVNLNIAISADNAELVLFEVSDTGLSTTTERYAEMYRAEGREVIRRAVPCRSLDEVIAEHVSGDIHFLKVDVEGAEGAVLNSISLDRHRPWIMVIEATEPNSQRPAFEEWEPRILASGYDMVYEDGLNRFYVAREHAELKGAFRLPPNHFDSFILYSDWCIKGDLEARTRDLEASQAVLNAWNDGAVMGELRQRLVQQRAVQRLQARRLRELQAERDALVDRQRGLSDELGALRPERDMMSARLDLALVRERELAGERDALRSERDAVSLELDQSRDRERAMAVELGVLRPERDTLSAQLDQSRDGERAMAVELGVLRRERDTLLAQLDQSRDGERALAVELGVLRPERDTLSAQLDQSRDRERALADELGVLRPQRETLAAQLAQAVDGGRELAEELAALRRERDDLLGRSAELSARLEHSLQSSRLANAEIERLRPCEAAMIMAEGELALIRRSLSWRLTRPLRGIRSIIRRCLKMTLQLGRTACRRFARLLVRIPGARMCARRLLAGRPNLKHRLIRMMYDATVAPSDPVSAVAARRSTNVVAATGPDVVAAAVPESDQRADLSRSANEALKLLKR